MPKHNNIIPNAHFRKHWQGRVRTWFNQPARKQRRRAARLQKAARTFPRPVAGSLRPEVRCPTIRYNLRVREGRGFTIEEIKAAGFVNAQEARSLGVAVDTRRKNKSEEAFQSNVKRLQTYKASLVVFHRASSRQVKVKKQPAGDRASAVQHKGVLVPLSTSEEGPVARKITEEEKKGRAYLELRRARHDLKHWGKKQKAAEAKAEKAKGGLGGRK